MKTCHPTALALTFIVAIASTSLPAKSAAAPARSEQAGRDDLRIQLEENLAAGKRTLAEARRQAKHLRGETRQRLEAAAVDVQAAERRLRESLREMEEASVAQWREARLILASDYEAYARALGEVQRIVSITTESEDDRFARRRAYAERDR